MSKRDNLVNKVAEQAVALNRAHQRIEELARLQLHGPAAAIAREIDTHVNAWVENGFVIDEATGVPTYNHDTVYSMAVKSATQNHATEVFKAADPEKQLSLVRSVLQEDEVRQIATTSLGQAILQNPELIKDVLTPDEVQQFLEGLVSNEAVRSSLIKRLVERKSDKAEAARLAQAEYDEFGHVSTDNLLEGTTVQFTTAFSILNDAYSTVIGRVIKTDDGQNWISLISERSSKDYQLKTMIALELAPHALFRLGHGETDQSRHYKLIPGTPWTAFQKYSKGVTKKSYKQGTINSLTLNDIPVNFKLR